MRQALLLFFIFIGSNLIAQPNNQQDDRFEELNAIKIAFITDQLNLTSVEAQNFWPVYNQHTKAFDAIRKKQRLEQRQNLKNGENLTELKDDVAEKFINSFLIAEEEQLELKKNLIKECSYSLSETFLAVFSLV